ncbi:50S ribosomal L25 [Micractinium conductrix]|uniref:50S ribosomal L25 n=1 Tax=Micractinium conductrix TaxID=554055 RepID=A0A2P6VIG9_9CHLO|nr:50S ribosomal L25 [Micractinium conductrix]|eukprot:PSC73857.1 50S ribosomal L25 [Micractinium conductrix]
MLRQGVARVASSMPAMSSSLSAALSSSLAECSTSGRLLPALAARFSAAAAASAAEPPMLVAEPRGDAGSIAATRLRRGGRTPGIVFSGPGGEQQLLALDSKELGRLVTKLGRTAWACSVFNLEIQRPEGGSDTVRALGRQVHMAADTDAVENVTFIYCPPDRQVRVDVPLKIIGDDISPGIKAGGRLNWIRRTIPCTARGDAIPSDFTIDISKMGLNDKLYFTDLSIPVGAALNTKLDTSLPILKVAK